MIFYLVCDTSGSMGEGGKPFSMRTAVMTVTQWARLGNVRAEIRLCGWASEARLFPNWSTKDEFPDELLACCGASNSEALIQRFGKTLEGKVLLFTDGYWTRDGARRLKQWRECLPQDTFRIIKIGSDANPQLKGPDVFVAEDLFVALDGWIEGGMA